MSGKGRHRLEQPNRRKWIKAVAVVGLASISALSASTTASADTVVADATSVDVVPGDTVDISVGIVATSEGNDVGGCNVDHDNQATIAISVAGNNAHVTPNVASVSIEACDVDGTPEFEGAKTVTLSADSGATVGSSDTVQLNAADGNASTPNGKVSVSTNPSGKTVTTYSTYPGQFSVTVNYVDGSQAGPCDDAANPGTLSITEVPDSGTPGLSGWWTDAPTLTATGKNGTVQWSTDNFDQDVSTTVPTLEEGSQTVYARDVIYGTDDSVCATGDAASATYDVDSQAPTVSLSGTSMDGQTYHLGNVPAVPGCSATDPTPGSGLADADSATLAQDDCTVTGYGTSLGSHTLVAHAADVAGNSADETTEDATWTYSVDYGTDGGIRQPINSDNSSIFSRGKAVPVKFGLLYDENAVDGVNTSTGFDLDGVVYKTVSMTCPSSGMVSDSVEQTATVATAKVGIRYDASADQYVYNADLSGKAVGTCWKIRVILPTTGQQIDSGVFKLQK